MVGFRVRLIACVGGAVLVALVVSNKRSAPLLREVVVDRREFIRAAGTHKKAPRELKFTVSDLTHGEIGPQAAEGYVGFALYSEEVCYLCVVSLTGELVSVLDPGLTRTHFDAFKPVNPKTFLVSSNEDYDEFGHNYLWHWEAGGKLEKFSDQKVNSHDAQWDDGSIWVPTYEGVLLYGGEKEEATYDITSGDINHAQVLDDAIVLSDRSASNIVWYDRSTAEKTIIGEGGSVKLFDKEGNRRSSLFYGQHNAEYFGDGYFYLFDNNYETNNNSKAVVLKWENSEARVVWEYEFPGYSEVFGDNDRLPSGNALTNWWPTKLTNETGSADVRVMEITKTRAVAWQLEIFGDGCDEDVCTRSVLDGWKMYSAERFYVRPLVYDVKCANSRLSFATQNIFKQNEKHAGSYVANAVTGTFEWLPHWQRTDVQVVDPSFVAGLKATLAITNQFRQFREVEFTCI